MHLCLTIVVVLEESTAVIESSGGWWHTVLRSNRLRQIDGWYIDRECLWDIPPPRQGMSRRLPMCEIESRWVYPTVLTIDPVKDGEEM